MRLIARARRRRENENARSHSRSFPKNRFQKLTNVLNRRWTQMNADEEFKENSYLRSSASIGG